MGKYIVSAAKNGGYHFVLKAGNGEVIASSEVYTTLNACKNGVESIRKNCGAEVEDTTSKRGVKQTNPKYEIYMDKKGEYRFRLKAVNGEIIVVSEGYTAKSSCKNGIDSVKRNAPDSEMFVAE